MEIVYWHWNIAHPWGTIPVFLDSGRVGNWIRNQPKTRNQERLKTRKRTRQGGKGGGGGERREGSLKKIKCTGGNRMFSKGIGRGWKWKYWSTSSNSGGFFSLSLSCMCKPVFWALLNPFRTKKLADWKALDMQRELITTSFGPMGASRWVKPLKDEPESPSEACPCKEDEKKEEKTPLAKFS